jgi:hypothetical protein
MPAEEDHLLGLGVVDGLTGGGLGGEKGNADERQRE